LSSKGEAGAARQGPTVSDETAEEKHPAGARRLAGESGTRKEEKAEAAPVAGKRVATLLAADKTQRRHSADISQEVNTSALGVQDPDKKKVCSLTTIAEGEVA